MSAADTIFALASGLGQAGVAVIRISGDRAETAVAGFCARPLGPARSAVLRDLRDPEGGLIDRALVLRFPAGQSFTGEAVVEIQCHGGPAVVRTLLDRLGAMPGCRMAEPGEFTLRAFRNGRMDLAEVEALGDLVSAETEAQRRQAAAVMDGGLREVVASWRRDLVSALALIEATIDWSDEEVPEDVSAPVAERLERVGAALQAELRGADRAKRLRAGFEVALVGPPNAGKSTLLNALAARPAALTSPYPGTTRDVLEVRCDLGGVPVTFLDMAGLRETGDPIEALGVERARTRGAAADLRLILWDPAAMAAPEDFGLRREGDVTVATKADLGGWGDGLRVSGVTGEGLSALETVIRDRLRVDGASALATTERRIQAMRGAALALEEARAALAPEIAAEALRHALGRLEGLVGRVDADAVLDEVFRNFCLGK